MPEVSDAVSAGYNIRGNSPAHSYKAPTKNGASTLPRKPAKIRTENEIKSLQALASHRLLVTVLSFPRCISVHYRPSIIILSLNCEKCIFGL